MSGAFAIIGRRLDGVIELLAQATNLGSAVSMALDLAEELGSPSQASLYDRLEIAQSGRLVISIMIIPNLFGTLSTERGLRRSP